MSGTPLKTEVKDKEWVFHVAGDFPGIEAVLLTNKIEAIEPQECSKVVVDLSHATFIESTALGSLIYCLKYLEKRGMPFYLADSTEHAMELFRGCPLDKVFSIVEPTDNS